MGAIKYSLATSLTGYPRAFIVGLKHRKHLIPFLYMGAVVLSILGFFFYWNWFNALFIFALPMWISLYITAWHTYYHHAGLESQDDMEASYNILYGPYNFFTGNLGYHTAHHFKQGLHWSKLPELHEQLKEKIPQELYRHPPLPFKWFIPRNRPAFEV